MKEYQNVDVTIRERIVKRRDITPKELADIIDSVGNVTFREALVLISHRNKNRVIGLAQALHGVLYENYYRMAKYFTAHTE